MRRCCRAVRPSPRCTSKCRRRLSSLQCLPRLHKTSPTCASPSSASAGAPKNASLGGAGDDRRALLKHRRRQDVDDRDRCKYTRHDQEHDGRGGIQESHRRLHALCAQSAYARPAVPPAGPLHLPRADSFSHYTLDAIIGNACRHGLAPATTKENAVRHQVSQDTRPGIHSCRGADPTSSSSVLHNCHKLCIIFPFGLRSAATGGRP